MDDPPVDPGWSTFSWTLSVLVLQARIPGTPHPVWSVVRGLWIKDAEAPLFVVTL